MKIAADTNMLMMSLAFTTKLEPDNMKSMKMADKAKFHTIDHKEVDKDMIRIHGDMNAIVDDEKTLFIMKMKGNFSFIGFMPKMDFNKYMKEKFDFVKFREEVLKMYSTKKEMVDLKMPCLHIDKEYHLMDIFNMLGVKKDSLAKMNSWPMIGEQLKMGEESIHRTMLMIDVHNDQIQDTMEGVKEIEINRPFSFVIMDHTHHLPMFTGMIMM